MKEVVNALRRLAKETELVFAAEQLREAADLIESLQADNAELRKANSEYQDAQHPLFMALSASQRRADAAVEDLRLSNTRKFNNPCEFCKHQGQACAPVGIQDVCGLWQWRGAQAGEGNE